MGTFKALWWRCCAAASRALLLLGVALVIAAPVQAQPVQGVKYKEFVPLGSGRSVPLPEGQWEMTQTTLVRNSGFDWEVFVLKNAEADAQVPYMVIRQSNRPLKWGGTQCTSDTGNAWQFMVNTHNTLTNQLVNKCSRLFALDNLENWMRSKSIRESDYWKDSLPGLLEPGKPKNQGIVFVEIRVQSFDSLGVEISLFVAPPKGVAPALFRDNYKSGAISAEHRILANWVAIYVELIEQAFFNKSPTALIALRYPTSTKVANAPAAAPAPALEPEAFKALGSNRPNRATGAVAALSLEPGPSKVPATSVAMSDAAKLDAERKAIDRDKLEIAQQMEKMQAMLAQLQKANADASKVTQAAAAPAPSPTQAKVAPPQIFANRKALVIGNDLYTDVSKLNNAGADAEAMAKSLTEVGYVVSKHLNLNEKSFKVALRDFRQKVQGGDEVLFFYAGHGVQLANANYLLPIDIKGESEEQIKDDAIQLQRFLEDMQDKKTKFALAVIDACRDNPFKSQGRALGGRGLAPTTAATGQMVMFSAGSGQQALDKLGPKDVDRNGLFTRIFIKEMHKPGVSVDRVLRNVRNQVVEQARSVGHEQTPALYDQSIGEFFFLN
jgi:uncharacterized caspase-like protein